LASVAVASQSAQLYISSIPASGGPTSLSGPQANAVIAHHLGVAQYERLPPASRHGQGNWQDALGSELFGSEQKVVVILECPSVGCGGRSPLPQSNRDESSAALCSQLDSRLTQLIFGLQISCPSSLGEFRHLKCPVWLSSRGRRSSRCTSTGSLHRSATRPQTSRHSPDWTAWSSRSRA